MAAASTARRLETTVVAASFMALLVPAAATASVDPEPRYAAIERVVDDAMEAHGVPGVSVAIVEDFEVRYARGFGFAEPGRPVGTDTLFQAASLSKPVSAVVAAAAAENGLVDLEADTAAMLMSWQLPPMPYDGPITLRMLFAHRAGINVPGFPGYRHDESLPDLPQILDGVRQKNEPIRVVAEPGVERVYSGGGFIIAQLAIQDHVGASWEEMAATLAFGPLGLDQSTYRILDDADRARVAVGYRQEGAEVAGGWRQCPETAPASLWTTASEYGAFVIDIMRSHETGTGVVLDQSTARLLLDPGYAVGFGISREEGGIAMGHDGANEGYRSGFRALPHLGEGVIVLTNSDSGDAVVSAIIDAVGEELGWPWTGWSTPLWAVASIVLGLLGLVSLAAWLVIRRGHRSGIG